MLDLLPEDIMCLVVHFVMTASPPRLGVQRQYGVVGTRIVVRDEKVYRRDNTPPTPVVKRALVGIWRSGMTSGTHVEFQILTLGTGHVVRYHCALRGFVDGAPAPSELSHLNIAAA
eukprot:jgi/Tetstr1/453912/TSEL_040831.t1